MKQGTTELTVELKITIPNEGDDIAKAHALKGKPTDWLTPANGQIKINKASVTKVTMVKVGD